MRPHRDAVNKRLAFPNLKKRITGTICCPCILRPGKRDRALPARLMGLWFFNPFRPAIALANGNGGF